ncbi:MAG: T9SS type A sorting domain-containing protein [Chitinophagales bacterium]|nr:T9SS type A sorting domain-containing protein [Chitinophagales bacterium]
MRFPGEKLLSYSTFALVYLQIHDSEAQAVYTDIDPDVSLDMHGEAKYIDMDNNGTTDYIFLNWSYNTITYDGEFILEQRLWIGPNLETNSVAASTVNFGSGVIAYGYALAQSSLIDEFLNFENIDLQRLAFKNYYMSFGSTWQGGFWYPELLDHYLGVYFIDSEDCKHYGWIRCDVMAEGRTLIVKDFAYESKCDLGIIAGDTIGDTTVAIDEINTLDVAIYSLENTIYINLDKIIGKIEVHIYDLVGKIIYSNQITEQSAFIRLSEPEGIYIVEIVSDKNKYSKKVYIN